MRGISALLSKVALPAALFAAALGLVHAPPSLAEDRPVASPEVVGLSAAQLRTLDATMHRYVDDGEVGGVVTLIARRGKIAHFDAYGWADRETGQPMRRDTAVRMFSMTKPIASVALLMLYEEGRFQLSDPLEKHLPEFAEVKVFAGRDADGKMILEEPRRKPTIQDVFRHTAGFTYGDFGDEELNRRYGAEQINQLSQAEFARALATYPLAYHPGEKWVYSVAHDVQASLVEHFSGMSFADFVRTRIFEPLDMRSSYFGQPVERPENYATLYTRNEAGEVVPVPWDLQPRYGGAVLGGSGLSSTARDYLQFAQMLLNGGQLDGKRLLNPRTIEFMTTNHVPEGVAVGDYQGRGYGLGVEVVTDPAQYGLPLSVGQYGWSGAATTYFAVDPEEDMVAILVTQMRPMNLEMWRDFITQSHLAVMD